MEEKRDNTKDLLTQTFKELVVAVPFEKIIIKNITDQAGVNRSVFYKHFQDKYEILEYILEKDIEQNLQVLLDNNMEEDIFKLLSKCLEKDQTLFKKLYQIEGNNSFEELMLQYLYTTFLNLLNKYPMKSNRTFSVFPKEAVARFYVFGLNHSLKYWLVEELPYSSEELSTAFEYMIRNSIMDLIDRDKPIL